MTEGAIIICRSLLDIMLCGKTLPEGAAVSECCICATKVALGAGSQATAARFGAERVWLFCSPCGMKFAVSRGRQMEVSDIIKSPELKARAAENPALAKRVAEFESQFLRKP